MFKVGDYVTWGNGYAGKVFQVDPDMLTVHVPERHNGKGFFCVGIKECKKLWLIEEYHLSDKEIEDLLNVDFSNYPNPERDEARDLVAKLVEGLEHQNQLEFENDGKPMLEQCESLKLRDAFKAAKEYMSKQGK